MAAAVFGLIETSEYFEHTNYVLCLVSRMWFKSPAHPLSNAPGFKRICQEMRKIWPWRFGISNLLIDCPCSVVPLTTQTAVLVHLLHHTQKVRPGQPQKFCWEWEEQRWFESRTADPQVVGRW